jgi:O-antigen/teichoic acid export membrane protein
VSSVGIAPSIEEDRGHRRFLGNTAWLVSAEMISKVASFVLVIIVARGLGAESYGLFAFALAFIPLFLMFGRGCVDTMVVRDLSVNRDTLPETFVNGLAARLALVVVGLVLAFLFSPLFVSSSGALLAVLILGVALLLDEISSYLGAIFQAFEQMRYNAIILTVNRVASTLLALAVVVMGFGLVAVSLTYMAGSLAAVVCAWLVLRRIMPPMHLSAFRRQSVRKIVQRGLPFGIASAFAMAAFRLDAGLIQAWKGPVAGGMYGIAYRFFEPALFIGWSITAATLPRMTRERSRGQRPRALELTIAIMLAVYLPFALGTPFASTFLVQKLFSDQYLPAVNAVPWLVAASLFYSFAHLGRVAAISLGHRSRITIISGFVLLGNLVANVFVIPRYSYNGAAVTTFFTEVADAAALATLVILYERQLRFPRAALVPISAAMAMVAAIMLTHTRGDDAIRVGAPVYLVGLVLAACLFEFGRIRGAVRQLISAASRRRARTQSPEVVIDLSHPSDDSPEEILRRLEQYVEQVRSRSSDAAAALGT